jgi:MFS family permease
MARRPLVVLCLSYLIIASVANGLGALWPVYIRRLGGGPAYIGYYTAVGTLAMTIGTVGAGWLADRLQRRRLLFCLACGLLGIVMVLMSHVQTLTQLTVLNFFGGIATGAGYGLVAILGGLLAGEDERGSVFGILTLAMNASLLVGGGAYGPIADRWGFQTLFLVSAALSGLCLTSGLFLTDVRVARVSHTATRPGTQGSHYSEQRGILRSGMFRLLLGATFFSAFAWLVGRLGLFMVMSQLGFAATTISLATAFGGIVSMPAPLIFGWLSDRFGRKHLVILCYLAGLISLPLLAWARVPGSFWIVAVLNSVLYTSTALGSALVTDTVPRESLDMGLSLLWGATNIGTVLASPATGLALQNLGQRNTFLIAMLAPLAAIALFLPVRERLNRNAYEATASS